MNAISEYYVKYSGKGKFLARLNNSFFGVYRRRDIIERDREKEQNHEIRNAVRLNSASTFLQETNHDVHDQLCCDLSGSTRREFVGAYQSRPTIIRASLWDARVSKVRPSGERD